MSSSSPCLLLSRVCLLVAALAVIPAPTAAQTTSIAFQAYHSVTPIEIPDAGAALTYPVSIPVSGLTGTVQRVAIALQGLTHPRVTDLDILLVSPSGSHVMLMSDVGGSVTDTFVLFESAGSPLTTVVEPYTPAAPADFGAGDQFPAPAPAGPYTTNLNAFNAEDPNGVWQLYIVDDLAGMSGSLAGVTLLIEPRFRRDVPALVPPSGTTGVTDSPLRVRGLQGAITRVEATVHIIHPHVSDLSLTLIGPDGTEVRLATNVGGNGANYGTFCDNPTTFSSAANFYPLITSGTPPFPDTYRPEESLHTFDGKSGDAANGIWTLRIADGTAGNAGGLVCWGLHFETELQEIAPIALTARSIVGNQVSLWWLRPFLSTGQSYILEGGLQPGDTLAQLPLNSGRTTVTLPLPSGVFYLRLRGQSLTGALSAPSNEIRIVVNAPEAPSPPKNVRVARHGTALDLSWTNSYQGGEPLQLALDATGSATGTVPLPLGEHVSFTGVPPGMYSLTLRALNAAGSSTASAPVSVDIPVGNCNTPPATPVRFVGYAVGNTVHLAWEQPLAGGAATSHLLIVTGDFIGSVPVLQTNLSAPVGPGTYQVRVAALNQCGSSLPTSARTIVVQ